MVGWLLDLIYGSYRVEFERDFDLPESIRRLSEATSRSVFSALTHQAAVGKVSESRVSLQRVIPFCSNSSKPFFIGEFVVRNDRTVLSGRFTLPWWTKAFMSVGFGFLLLWIAVATIVAILHPTPESQLMPLCGIAMFIFGIGLACFGKWLSRNDIAWLSEKIENALSSGSDRHENRAISAPGVDCFVSG
jgi:hypothetical protein